MMAWDRGWARIAPLALLAAAPLAASRPAHASNLFNIYAGAAYVRAHLNAVALNPLANLHRGDSGFQLTAGVRGLEMFGVEVDYFDLGGGSASLTGAGGATITGTHLSQKGEAAFGVFYLPLPEPFIDVYVKAGVSRMTSDLGGALTVTDCTISGCAGSGTSPFQLHHTNTGFAAGAGVQWNVGHWAVRAEYDRLTALGAHPDLFSVGVIRTFL